MQTDRSEVYEAIDTERTYQRAVWGNDGVDNPLSIGEFILMLEELTSQARGLWIKEAKPEVQTLNHIRKIAAAAVNCMEQHGAPKREPLNIE